MAVHQKNVPLPLKLHRRLKVIAAKQDCTVKDLVRVILEREFPEEDDE